MQTRLVDAIAQTIHGAEADRILRSCVHCGFCNATCPTYQLRGDELDGPRGRIYLIKQVLEGEPPSRRTQQHLDRCLTCLNCMTTCPSGVDYRHLVEIGREQVERQVARPWTDRLQRRLLRQILPNRMLFSLLLRTGQALRPLLPGSLRRRIPERHHRGSWPPPSHVRRMLVLQGCVQPALQPDIDAALARLLNRLDISLIPTQGGCCGAIDMHLNAEDAARDRARRNIDAWWPQVTAGIEAILVTASGCGTHVRDYGHLLREDPDYRDKALRVSELTRDPCEILNPEDIRRLAVDGRNRTVAFHPPCSLQHGLKLGGRVEALLRSAGFQLLPVAESHLCCGSAGTYSLLQPDLAAPLRQRKLEHLERDGPQLIATANIGCQTHLQAGTDTPVVHWIKLLDNPGLQGH
ncbi:glycolate oxidase iron-sulfur subunit [Ectothiorhodospira shaposhnikovii]|uniref:glycolate oxidase subunit GlcF n=1 Tax=Ectothiorhodospira shaposhnikovii TaxID=1054 RepID=UPI001906A13C|nr:glycolate oxidase subunit GlcF [Ectothiorhodospira shaposhnikovii]MBK1673502.1 glycolate oxidase iron-sulfur subunit [Ectothiorhodospira shaposhnikovii]